MNKTQRCFMIQDSLRHYGALTVSDLMDACGFTQKHNTYRDLKALMDAGRVEKIGNVYRHVGYSDICNDITPAEMAGLKEVVKLGKAYCTDYNAVSSARSLMSRLEKAHSSPVEPRGRLVMGTGGGVLRIGHLSKPSAIEPETNDTISVIARDLVFTDDKSEPSFIIKNIQTDYRIVLERNPKADTTLDRVELVYFQTMHEAIEAMRNGEIDMGFDLGPAAMLREFQVKMFNDDTVYVLIGNMQNMKISMDDISHAINVRELSKRLGGRAVCNPDHEFDIGSASMYLANKKFSLGILDAGVDVRRLSFEVCRQLRQAGADVDIKHIAKPGQCALSLVRMNKEKAELENPALKLVSGGISIVSALDIPETSSIHSFINMLPCLSIQRSYTCST